MIRSERRSIRSIGTTMNTLSDLRDELILNSHRTISGACGTCNDCKSASKLMQAWHIIETRFARSNN